MKNIKGAIFDVDGTLIDSMHIWDSAAADYLKSHGISPPENLIDELRAIGGSDIPEYFRVKYSIDKTEEDIALEIRNMIINKMLVDAPIKEGVLDVLEGLKKRGIRMCAATASPRIYVEPVLEKHGILGYMERIFTCDEENTTKSKPDIYIRASKYLRTVVYETLVFEDALYAVKTAKKAGFPVVGLYDLSSAAHQEEIKSTSTYYYKSMTDFLVDFNKMSEN